MKNLLHSLAKGVQEKDLSKDDLKIIHDLILQKIVKSKNHYYQLDDKYRAGILDISSNGTGYLETFGEKKYSKDLLINSQDLKGGLKGDLVIAKRFFKKDGSRARAKVELILKRALSHVVVYTKTIHKRVVGINIKTGLQVSIFSSQKSLKALPNETVLKINNESGNIEEVLGVLSDENVDEKISLAIYNKCEDFSKEAENQAISYGKKVDKSLYEDLEDLTDLPFCTIDPIDAKDFDDAIYFDEKENTIYVAIADVSSYVFPFDSIDKEAKQRGFSIYFPHKSIPMLPRNLSENICSLKPHEDRLAFCFKITIDEKTLKVKNEEILNCVINSKKRYNYDEIDMFLDGKLVPDKNDEKIFPWLEKLKILTDKLRKKRLENAFEFRSDEIRMQVDENQHLISTSIEKETPSHGLIEDCMLLANKAAAKRIDYGVFRNHESPSYERIDSLLVDLEMIGLNFEFSSDLPKLIRNIQTQADILNIREDVDKLIIKAQKKAMYEAQNKGHFGLGFDKYSHFTSPIRRYSDLILHRLLKAKIANDKKSYNYQLENIDEICDNLSQLERQSDRVAFDYMDRKFARWAKENINKEFEVIITEIGRNIIGKLDDKLKGARIFIIDEDAELLERVKVKIVESDIAQAIITAKITQRMD